MRAGDLAHDFTLSDQDNVGRTLSTMLDGGPVVLFFYPRALSIRCTIESCHFRDRAADFAALGAQRVGVSMDAVSRQHEFATKHGFDFPLLSDVEGVVGRRYGVRRNINFLRPIRTTYVIAADRRIVTVLHNSLNMSAHADLALRALAPS